MSEVEYEYICMLNGEYTGCSIVSDCDQAIDDWMHRMRAMFGENVKFQITSRRYLE